MRQSVSFCKGRGSLAHNNRVFTAPNVNKERTPQNVTYVQEPLHQAYEKLFGAAVSEYNSTVKRSDRKITNYMDHIRNSKNGEKLFYESVVQIGNKYTCSAISENGSHAAKILDEYMQEFQKRNPNLYVFNAVLHLDEATPHVHIDYIPVAKDYKRGMKIRNSLDKALRQQGITGAANKKDNATQHWQEREKQALAEVMERHGWEREKETGLGREKMTVTQFKATMAEIENRATSLPDQIERKTAPLAKGKVIVSSEDLDALEMRAKLSVVHEEAQHAVQEKMDEKLHAIDEYENQQILLIQKQLDDAKKERANAESMSLKAGQSLYEANQVKASAQAMYDQQRNLNQSYQNAQTEIASLKEQISTLRRDTKILATKLVEKESEIEQTAEMAQKPLRKTIAELNRKIENMAAGEAVLLKAVRYVADRFAGTVTFGILDAVHKLGKRWLHEDGFPELATDNSGLPNAVAKELHMKLIYQNGPDGKGLYSQKGVCVANVESLKEAKEKFPSCQIENGLNQERDLIR